MAAFACARSPQESLGPARAALAAVVDAAAVLVPIVTALVRRHAYAEARVLIAEQAHRLDDGFADLLLAKISLASGDAATAVGHLEAALSIPSPLFQARNLLPQALRAAGRHAEARAALRDLAAIALYPHGPLATLAEWSWLDGDRDRALADMQQAIDAAPLHRRGRLRTRRAEWLLARNDRAAARAELQRSLVEDPAYARARDVLATIA
jgi:tetratricopeptide (TPR) repeat protein